MKRRAVVTGGLLSLITMSLACNGAGRTGNEETDSKKSLIETLEENGWSGEDLQIIDEISVRATIITNSEKYELVITIDSGGSYKISSINNCSRPFGSEAIGLSNIDLTLAEVESILGRLSPENFANCQQNDDSKL